jgi:hypothetical protein
MNSGTSLSARIDRWRDFTKPNASPGFMFYAHFEDSKDPSPPRPLLWPDKRDERIEWALKLYEFQQMRSRFLDDDRVPYLSNVTGTEVFAEAFGCPINREDDRMPFALSIVRTPAEADALKVPELDCCSLSVLFEIADELHRRGGPDALMKLVDVQSPMDITALIWDKSELYVALVEAPESVKNLTFKVRTLLINFFDEWFRRYGTTYISHHPDYLMDGGVTLSEDEIGSVSDEMFVEFFRDELVALSEHFGGLGIHCCANARHHWANLKALPGLRVLNLSKPPQQEESYVLDAYRFYGNSMVQVHAGWAPDCEPERYPYQYPENTRVIFSVTGKDRDDAMRICDELNGIRAKVAVS